MKIKLTKPLVQTGRVLPAGVIIRNAPPGLMERLCRIGKAIPVLPDTNEKKPEESPKKAVVKRRGRGKRD